MASFKSSFESMLEAHSPVLQLVLNTPNNILVACSVCNNTIKNPNTSNLYRHLRMLKHRFLLQWDAGYQVSKSEFYKLALMAYSNQQLELHTAKDPPRCYLLCTECSLTFHPDEANLVLPHLKTHLLATDENSASPAPKETKRKLPTDKEKYIKKELDRDTKENRNVLQVDNDGELYCRLCQRILSPTNFFNYPVRVNEHMATDVHLINIAKSNGNIAGDSSFDSAGDGFISPPPSPKKKPTRRTITKDSARQALATLINNNVPLSQSNKRARTIIGYQAKREISPTFIREKAVPLVKSDVLSARKHYFSNKDHLYLSIDETSDGKTTYLGLVIGVMDKKMRQRRIKVKEVTETDAESLHAEIISQLNELDIEKNKIKAFVSDSAMTMAACAKLLKKTSPGMVYVMCVSHKINLVANFIKKAHPAVDSVIGAMKQLMKRSKPRAMLYKAVTGGQLPVIPTPHEIRWGSWQVSANYIIHYHQAIVHFISSLKSNKKDTTREESAETKLTSLQANFDDTNFMLKFHAELLSLKRFMRLPAFIIASEKARVPFTEATAVIHRTREFLNEAVECSATENEKKVATDVIEEFNRCMRVNTGLHQVEELIANGEDHMQYCPITSTETERFFHSFRLNFLNAKKYTGSRMETMTSIHAAMRPNKAPLKFDKSTNTAVRSRRKARRIEIYGPEYAPKPFKLLSAEEVSGQSESNKKLATGKLKRAPKEPKTSKKPRKATPTLKLIKPKSAYLHFCADERPRIKSQFEQMSVGAVSKELGYRWRNLPTEQRATFEIKARKDKAEKNQATSISSNGE